MYSQSSFTLLRFCISTHIINNIYTFTLKFAGAVLTTQCLLIILKKGMYDDASAIAAVLSMSVEQNRNGLGSSASLAVDESLSCAEEEVGVCEGVASLDSGGSAAHNQDEDVYGFEGQHGKQKVARKGSTPELSISVTPLQSGLVGGSVAISSSSPIEVQQLPQRITRSSAAKLANSASAAKSAVPGTAVKPPARKKSVTKSVGKGGGRASAKLQSSGAEQWDGEDGAESSSTTRSRPPSVAAAPAPDSHHMITVKGLPLSIAALLSFFGRSWQMLHKYRARECIELLSGLPAAHLGSGWVQWVMGRAYFDMCDYKLALRAFKEMQRLEPFRVKGLEMLSTTLFQLKREKELCALSQQVVEIDKLSPETWCVIGNCFSLQKETDTAIKYFERALQMCPNFTYAHTLCGHEMFANDDLDKATTAYSTALRCDDRHYSAWYGLGTIYERQERYELAEYHFRKALAVNPMSSVLRRFLGMVLLTQSQQGVDDDDDELRLKRERKAAESLAVLSEACEIDPQNATVRYNRVSALMAADRYVEALKDLEIVVGLAPGEPKVHTMLGQLYQRFGRTQEALRSFNAAVALDAKGETAAMKASLETLQIPIPSAPGASADSPGNASLIASTPSSRGYNGGMSSSPRQGNHTHSPGTARSQQRSRMTSSLVSDSGGSAIDFRFSQGSVMSVDRPNSGFASGEFAVLFSSTGGSDRSQSRSQSFHGSGSGHLNDSDGGSHDLGRGWGPVDESEDGDEDSACIEGSVIMHGDGEGDEESGEYPEDSSQFASVGIGLAGSWRSVDSTDSRGGSLRNGQRSSRVVGVGSSQSQSSSHRSVTRAGTESSFTPSTRVSGFTPRSAYVQRFPSRSPSIGVAQRVVVRDRRAYEDDDDDDDDDDGSGSEATHERTDGVNLEPEGDGGYDEYDDAEGEGGYDYRTHHEDDNQL